MKTDFRKCATCGDIFVFRGDENCPKCTKELDKKFAVLKKYLYKNPGAGVVETAEATEIEEKIILSFLRDGRLELASDDGFLTCMNCGAPIKSGKYCVKCSANLQSTLEKVIRKPEAPKSDEKSKLHIDVNSRRRR